MKGQEIAKRALEIAAAGGHNLLMSGPPGAGKSLLAACLPGILPPLEPAEALEVSMVASVAGELEGGWKMKWRLRLFFWVVKMQAKWPLVPRISFAPMPEKANEPQSMAH